MRSFHLVLSLMLALCLATAIAQDNTPHAKPAGHPRHKAVAQGTMPHASATKAEMQKLNYMIGDWTTAEKFEANELSPKAGTGTGRARLHWGPGKMSILQTYRSNNKVFGSFDGHSSLFWDAKSGEYKTFWCDSMMGCTAQFGTGQWEGDKLVFTSEAEYMGKKVSMRDTFSDIKPDSFTLAEESSVDGGPMKPSMTIQYTKAARPAPAAKTEGR